MTPAVGARWLRPRAGRDGCTGGSSPIAAAPVGAIARQRELSLVAVMLVAGRAASPSPGAAVPDGRQPDARSRSSPRSSPSPPSARRSSSSPATSTSRSRRSSAWSPTASRTSCSRSTPRRPGRDRCSASALGLVLGMVNGVLVTVLRVPSIVATLGTLSIFRGIDYLIAGSHQVPLARLPRGLHRLRRATRSSAIPIFVLVAIVVVVIVARSSCAGPRFGRQVYAVGSNPEAAAILGIPARVVVVRRVRPVRAAGRRRRRDVGHGVRDDQRHGRDRRHARRSSPRSSSAASTSSAASGTVVGAALGALSSASSPTR